MLHALDLGSMPRWERRVVIRGRYDWQQAASSTSVYKPCASTFCIVVCRPHSACTNVSSHVWGCSSVSTHEGFEMICRKTKKMTRQCGKSVIRTELLSLGLRGRRNTDGLDQINSWLDGGLILMFCIVPL